MTTARTPPAWSAWARLCPDAFLAEWLDESTTLPRGRRLATDAEAALITGQVSEAEYLGGSKDVAGTSPSPAVSRGGKKSDPKTAKGRMNRDSKSEKPAKRKMNGYRQFRRAVKKDMTVDALAIVVWYWMWDCEREGECLASHRKLAEWCKINKDTAGDRVKRLIAAGYVGVISYGTEGESPSIYWISPTPLRGGTPSGPVGRSGKARRPARSDATVRPGRT